MHLAITLSKTHLSALESAEVTVTLGGATSPCLIPSLYDDTAALTFELRTEDGALVRRQNGITSQRMLGEGRVDERPDLCSLLPGEAWSRTIDLAPYHHCFPAGRFTLRAVYRYPPARVEVISPSVPLEVQAAPLLALQVLRDNPVLDGRTLLLRSAGAEGPGDAYTLRHYTADCPLAAWYSAQVPLPPAAREVLLASPAYLDTATFDHLDERWLLYRLDDALHAQRLRTGRREGSPLVAALPLGRRLFAAHHGRAEPPQVLLRSPDGSLECYDLVAGSLVLRFARPLPSAAVVSAHADRETLHIVDSLGGLRYQRLDREGGELHRAQLLSSRLACYSLDLDVVEQVVRALFWAGPHGRTLFMTTVDLRSGALTRASLDLRPLRGELRELAFALDRHQRYHVLLATSRGHLYYLAQGRSLQRLARGQAAYHPQVVAGRSLFLGFARPPYGYRFLRATPYRRGRLFAEEEGTR